ncbi:MAG TPA: hypothetical protein VF125_12295 [Solirubrobacterales bacterium]
MRSQIKHYGIVAAEACIAYFAPRALVLIGVFFVALAMLVSPFVPAFTVISLTALFAALARKKTLKFESLPSEAFARAGSLFAG